MRPTSPGISLPSEAAVHASQEELVAARTQAFSCAWCSLGFRVGGSGKFGFRV